MIWSEIWSENAELEKVAERSGDLSVLAAGSADLSAQAEGSAYLDIQTQSSINLTINPRTSPDPNMIATFSRTNGINSYSTKYANFYIMIFQFLLQ